MSLLLECDLVKPFASHPPTHLMSAFFSCYTPEHVRHPEGNIAASKLQMWIFYDDVHTLV